MMASVRLSLCCAAIAIVRAQTPTVEEQAAAIRSRVARVDITAAGNGCEAGAAGKECEFLRARASCPTTPAMNTPS